MKPSTIALKGAGFLRSHRKEQLESGKIARGMKSSRPKMTPIRSAARGQDCTLRLDGVCNFNPETTVLCHSPYLADGRGMGIKAPDECAAFGCNACHDVLDGRRPRPDWLSQGDLQRRFYKAVDLTRIVLRCLGTPLTTNNEAANGLQPVAASNHIIPEES
jgi:hypothetical protein